MTETTLTFTWPLAYVTCMALIFAPLLIDLLIEIAGMLSTSMHGGAARTQAQRAERTRNRFRLLVLSVVAATIAALLFVFAFSIQQS